MDAPSIADEEVRDLAEALKREPGTAALVLAETAIGVKQLRELAGKARVTLMLLLAGLVVDLILRLASVADQAKAFPPF